MASPDSATRVGRPGDVRVGVGVLLLLLVVYAATASFRLPYNVDAMTNALTAWQLADRGSVVLDRHTQLLDEQYFGAFAWIVESKRGPVAMYPPGTALLASIAYGIDRGPLTTVRLSAGNRPELGEVSVATPSLAPATATAVSSTAATGALLALVASRLAGRKAALGTGLVFGLGTGAWSVASDMLWQHGPAMMWIALGLLLASHERFGTAGLALALAIVTRPHIALIAVGMGVVPAIRRKSYSPMLRLGLTSSLGIGALLAFNYWLFGRPSIRGGYPLGFVENLASMDLAGYAKNVWGSLFDFRNGLLIWAPFLLVPLAGLPLVWRKAPDWSLGAAIGGLVYLLVQLKANRFSGGDGHFAYRYPLEALASATPLLSVSTGSLLQGRRVWRVAFLISVVLALLAQAYGAVLDVTIA